MRFLDLVSGPLSRVPDKVAVADGGTRLSFADVDRRIDSLGAALQQRGLVPGDRVALLARNELEYLEIQGACLRHGFALVPLNVRLAPPELEFIVGDCRPAVLIAGRGLEDVARDVAHATGVPHLLGLGTPSELPTYDEALAGAGPVAPPPTEESLVSTILYTSGTTGRPKGAMIDRRGFTARVLINSSELGVGQDDVHLAVLPMFHIAAFLTYAHVVNGGSIVMLREFTPEAVLDLVEKERVTTTCLVPTIIAMLTEHEGRAGHDLSSLRLVIYGGSSISPPALRRALAAFRCGFHQQYGLTESGGQTILRPADHDPDDELRLGSAGSEAVSVQVRVVDAEDRDVPDGELGEIVCRSPSLMVGYWNLPEATEEAFRSGWFHSGDVAYRDSHGYVHIADRRNDMIVTGGENVYPREVELVLAEHTQIEDVAVIGTPDPRWGEIVTAVVVGDALPVEEELRGWAQERLAAYKVPRRWLRVGELPRNATGKVLKHQLRETLSAP